VSEYKSVRRGWLTEPGDSADSFERVRALERVREWARQRFELPRDAPILISQIECVLPGCPPLETVIGFWIGEQHYHFKVFKPLEAIVLDDFPYAWLKDSLAVTDGTECGCC
jgi:nitrate reductase delta subunit